MVIKWTRLVVLVIILCMVVSVTQPVLAVLSVDPHENNPGLVQASGSIFKLDLGTASPVAASLNLMNLALSLLGGLCLVLLCYAGFLWIWARGNTEVVQKAKDIIEGSAIGLIIILAALGITQFVITQVANITGADVNQGETKTPSEDGTPVNPGNDPTKQQI